MKKLIFLLFVLVCGGAGAYWYWNQEPLFPRLPEGAYVGRISGIHGSHDEFATLYLERFPGSDTFLCIVFADGFRPQAISANSAAAGAEYRPLVLTHNNRRFALYGRDHNGELSGKVVEGEKTAGRWELRALRAGDLLASAPAADTAGFDQWLLARGQLRELKRELKQAETQLADDREKRDKLTKFVQDRTLLEDRAASRRDELKSQFDQGIAEKKQTAKEVADLVAELDLVGRITKRGQAVSLARRVANRENKWYMVNWHAEEDPTGVTEYLSDSPEVDIKKLDEAVAHAGETQALLHEIETEQSRIRSLEQQIQEGRSPAGTGEEQAPAAPVYQPQPAPQKKESLWDQIFG